MNGRSKQPYPGKRGVYKRMGGWDGLVRPPVMQISYARGGKRSGHGGSY